MTLNLTFNPDLIFSTETPFIQKRNLLASLISGKETEWALFSECLKGKETAVKIIRLVADFFPEKFVMLASKLDTTHPLLTSCIINAVYVSRILTCPDKLNESMPALNMKYVMDLGNSATATIDNPFCFEATSEHHLEDSYGITDKSFEEFKDWFSPQRRDIFRENTVDGKFETLKNILDRYDFNKNAFDRMKTTLQENKSSPLGYVCFLAVAGLIKSQTFHSFTIEQLPRSSLKEPVEFRIYQSWVGKYSLFDYLSSKYGMGLEKTTSEKELNEFLEDFEVFLCKQQERGQRWNSIIRKNFNTEASFNPLVAPWYQTKEVTIFSLKYFITRSEPENPSLSFQRLLKIYPEEFQEEIKTERLVVDKFFEINVAIQAIEKNFSEEPFRHHNYLRLMLQLFELISSKDFDIEKTKNLMHQKERRGFFKMLPCLVIKGEEFRQYCNQYFPHLPKTVLYPKWSNQPSRPFNHSSVYILISSVYLIITSEEIS